MAKISFFALRTDLIALARVASSHMDLPLSEVKLVTISNAVEEAIKSQNNGTDIIISRGCVAAKIRKNTDIPVIEITLTSQELGLLIYQAKFIMEREFLKIGLIGTKNLFCNTDYAEQLYNVKLITKYVDSKEDLHSAVDNVIENGAEFIMCGDLAIHRAEELGLPYLFLASTQDSVDEAFRIAKLVASSMDIERKNNAELNTLLNYAFNGIIKIDNTGHIVVYNHIAKSIFDIKDSIEITGMLLTDLVEELSQEMLHTVIVEGHEIYSVDISINQSKIIANLAPIKVNDHVEGAIFSFHEVKKLTEMSERIQHGLGLAGNTAHYTFDMMTESSPATILFIREAKLFGSKDAPILIYGEEGTEKNIVAQCIHNASPRRNEPFVTLDCSIMDAKAQQAIFSDSTDENEKHHIQNARNGTLFIADIEHLTPYCQRVLSNLLEKKGVYSENGKLKHLENIRVIVSTSKNPFELANDESLRPDLYYQLCTLTLNIPPLRQRHEDILFWISVFMRDKCEQYLRYLNLTDGAKIAMCNYEWPGNLIQLKSFCERLVITAPKRSVDERFINASLQESYPNTSRHSTDESTFIYQDPQAAELMEVLAKYHGNRSLAAQELSISTTTLWRKMKKYNLHPKN